MNDESKQSCRLAEAAMVVAFMSVVACCYAIAALLWSLF